MLCYKRKALKMIYIEDIGMRNRNLNRSIFSDYTSPEY